mgnify:FL=1
MHTRPTTNHFPLITLAAAAPFSLLLCSALLLAGLAFTGCASGAQQAGTGGSPGSSVQATGMPFSESSTVFTILPEESQARFLIEEIFNGEEKVVVGTTNQVSGQIALDLRDPATAAVGPIQINANSLVTDNGFRDRAVRSRILLAGIYEFITFTPTAVNGLPKALTVGETVEFTIAGDLTITTITQPVTLTVTAAAVSESRLAGQAATTIQRRDFDLVVPSATGVAAVGEEVVLELDFTAVAAE